MREIIQISVGQAGNNIGYKYLEQVLDEHCIDPDGIFQGDEQFQHKHIETYFQQLNNQTYSSRSVFIDSNTQIYDQISISPFKKIIQNSSIICNERNSECNWAKGKYELSYDILDISIDAIRQQSEKCDSFQGFQIINSLGGGTGGGFSSILLQNLKDMYPSKIISTNSILPSLNNNNQLESINTFLSLNEQLQFSDISTIFDNKTLNDICFYRLKLCKPQIGDLNHLVIKSLINMTSIYRSDDDLNQVQCMQQFAQNMVPFKNLKFLTSSFTPIYGRGSTMCRTPLIWQIMPVIFQKNYIYQEQNLQNGKMLAAQINFRGRQNKVICEKYYKVVNEQFMNLKKDLNESFVNIPDNFKLNKLQIGQKGMKICIGGICNNTSFQENLRFFKENSDKNFVQNKSLQHKYLQYGFCDMEYKFATNNIQSLISEYQNYDNYENVD